MTWLAAKFPTVKLCHHVLGQGYRNPALTAKMAATLQTLSGGRFILGIGAGWRGEEFERYGYDFPLDRDPHPPARRDRQDLQADVERGTRPASKAATSASRNAKAPPKPDPAPPIMIGGQGEQLMLPMIGRLADGWNTFMFDEEAWTRKRDVMRKSAEEAGRDPADITISVTREVGIPNTSQESEEWLEVLQHYRELGVRHFTCDFGHVTSTEPVLRFADEVIKPMRAS